jgi:hypothetical protein
VAFPFPLNPVDGQVVTQTQPDGSVLTATYNQSKNEWVIDRQQPAPTPITGTPPINVTASADGQVITWDRTLGTWVAKAPAASGSGQTFAKGTLAAPDTPKYFDPNKPNLPLSVGALQSTLENLHKELKAWDGTAWANVYSEDLVKQWIAAGSLFRSTLVEAGISALPAPANVNRGYYWTWAGTSGYVVLAGDTPLAPSLVGDVLNPGDWLQSDGTKFVHVAGDLLSKQRWVSLGSFLPWSDTSWEAGSVVSYKQAFFRSTTNVVAGDAPPGDGSGGNKWLDITPHPEIKLEELSDCLNLAAATDMQVPAWDAINNEWVPTQLALNDLSDVNADVTDPTSNGAVFQWDLATQQWVAANSLTLRLEDLGDTGPLSGATEGQVPSWDAAASEWKPLSVINPIPYFTGKYGVGSGGGTSWVPWANPKEGDIFVNKSTEPPHFEVYENGAWKIWNFATATRALGLLGDLANVDLGSKAPGNGDALIWSVKTQQWVSGNTPAHIAQYTSSSVYSEGTTVYYKGGIFKATRTILANESPEFLTGDVFLFYRAQPDGSGAFDGPFRVFRVEKVADATLPPAFTPSSNGRTNCVCYKDDRDWSVWEWLLVDSKLIVYGWVRKDGAYTKRTLWRSHFLPTKNKGTFVLWVVDDAKGTTVPKAREYPWEMLPIRGDLAALHDCHVDDPHDGDALVFNGTTNLWEAVPSSASALSEWSGTRSYKSGATVLRNNNLWFATADVAPGIEPGTLINPTSIAKGTQRSLATFGPVVPGSTHLETFDGTIPGAWNVGDYYAWSCGAPIPYTVPAGPFAGTVINSATGFLVVVDKDGTNGWLGTLGWELLQSSTIPATITASVTNPWRKELIDSYSKADVDNKVNALAGGMSHGEAVVDFLAAPPASPVAGEAYIVSPNATGAWAGKDNQIAQWLSGAWVFTQPSADDTHLVEKLSQMWHYNGTIWVKVADLSLKMVALTQAAYDGIATKDPLTLYIISA